MKKRFAIFSLIILLAGINVTIAQEIKELQYKPLKKEFVALADKLVEIDNTDHAKSIELCLEALKTVKDPYIRFDLVFWELAYHYAQLEHYDKCLETLKKGQDEGMYFFLRDGNRPFPGYLGQIKSMDGYKALAEKNAEMQKSANTSSAMEYMVMLPKGYDKSKKYPLLIISHGGIGSIPDLQYFYNSKKLRTEFIVAFFQGNNRLGSYTRSFYGENWKETFKTGYEQILANYAVDKTKVILGGPSAGSYRSLDLRLNNIIPAHGLLLSFGVAPQNIDSTAYINAAKDGLRVAHLCGENDWAIKQQKELAYKFDKYKIANRFVVFPEKGHEFPDNWPHHLDTSLEFILNEN